MLDMIDQEISALTALAVEHNDEITRASVAGQINALEWVKSHASWQGATQAD